MSLLQALAVLWLVRKALRLAPFPGSRRRADRGLAGDGGRGGRGDRGVAARLAARLSTALEFWLCLTTRDDDVKVTY
jgi:hypothetical protein